MQHDLFDAIEEDTWEVLEVREEVVNGHILVVYAHTRPVNWSGAEASVKLPWEE